MSSIITPPKAPFRDLLLWHCPLPSPCEGSRSDSNPLYQPGQGKANAAPHPLESTTGWKVNVVGNAEAWEAMVQAICHGGIALLLGQPVASGIVLTAELFSRSGRYSCWLRMAFVDQPAAPGGRHLVRCRFSDPLTEDELHRLLEQ